MDDEEETAALQLWSLTVTGRKCVEGYGGAREEIRLSIVKGKFVLYAAFIFPMDENL